MTTKTGNSMKDGPAKRKVEQTVKVPGKNGLGGKMTGGWNVPRKPSRIMKARGKIKQKKSNFGRKKEGDKILVMWRRKWGPS